MQLLALCFALLGGFFNGTYPVPIKARSVIEADVHPIVFQCYKSFYVFCTGWIFVLINVVTHKALTFEFTWWAVLSAFAWIPSGLTTIFSVPIIGVSMSLIVNSACGSILSFLVFWLVFHEHIKSHDIDGHTAYLAPAYLFMICLGMIALVLAPRVKFDKASDIEEDASEQKLLDELHPKLSDEDEPKRNQKASKAWHFLGLCAALAAGFFSACQYGVVTIGRQYEEHVNHCVIKDKDCPPKTKEQFNNFGSWMTSFGIGAMLSTAFYYGLFALYYTSKGQTVPSPARTWQVMKGPGTLAGLCWCLGNFFNTAAVVAGGNAIIMPISQCATLITSGAWGILYYKEVKGKNAALWVVAAIFTLAFMVALGLEKG